MKEIVKLGIIGTVIIFAFYLSVIYLYFGISIISPLENVDGESIAFISTLTIVIFRFYVGVLNRLQLGFSDYVE